MSINSSRGKAGSARRKTDPVRRRTGSARGVRTNSTSNRMSRQQKLHMQKMKKIRTLLIVSGALLLISLYFGFATYYHNRFIVRTTINGTSAAGLTSDEAREKLQQKNTDYVLTLKAIDGEDEVIRGTDIDLTYTNIGDVDSLMEKQNEWLWPFRLLFRQNLTIDADVSYDEAKLENAEESLRSISEGEMLTPVNAYLNVAADGTYEVVPEVDGTTVDIPAVKERIVSCIKSASDTLDLKTYQTLPTVRSDDAGLLKRQAEWNNYITAAGLNYYFFNGKETLDGPTIATLLSDDGTTVTLSTDAIAGLVAGWASAHDTYNNPFVFTSQRDGSEITIEGGGDYGWQTNQEATAADVKTQIEAHNTDSHDAVYAVSGLSDENSGLGWSYVEISIAEQTLWLYKDKNLVLSTPVVTGLPSGGRETYKGCYNIDYKEEHATLGTLDTQGYSSPVDYWAPFNQGEGLHDAPWRTEFGGNIYLTDGSHGCVNCPPAVMGQIFSTIFENEAVVIY